MIFTETAFLVFLAIVLPLFYLTTRWVALNNGVLLVAGYFFYGWAKWWFIFLLAASSFTDFYCAKFIEYG
jgi:alginate O-acetyltransferase complex protein AlgI